MSSNDHNMQQSSYFQNQSDLINSIERFLINLSIDDEKSDNILLIENSIDSKNNDIIKDYLINSQLNLSDIEENNSQLNLSEIEENNSELNQAMCEDNDTSYLNQIEQILDGIDNPKNMRGTLTILKTKGDQIQKQQITFQKDELKNVKINQNKKICVIF